MIAEHAHLSDPNLYERFYSVDGEPDSITIAISGEPRLEWALEHIPHEARVLDVGCYKGSVALPLCKRRRDLQITGVDISAPAIEQAKLFAHELGMVIQYQVARAEELPFRSEFDVVLLFEILEHVVDPHAVIAEARRACKPGGMILISSPVDAVEMESRSEQRIPGFERLHMHVRDFDPAVELADWPGVVTERRNARVNGFTFYLAKLPV